MEVEFDDRTILVPDHGLRLAQATWRGILVRKKLKQAQDEFTTVIKDIEGPDSKLQVQWQDSLFLPLHFDLSQGHAFHVTERSNAQVGQRQISGIKAIVENPIAKPDVFDNENHSIPDIIDGKATLADKSGDKVLKQGLPSKDEKQFVGLAVRNSDQDHEEKDLENPANTPCQSEEHHTSVWESPQSSVANHSGTSKVESKDKRALEDEKSQIAMELLWIQQAIVSRKQYLRLKSEL